MAATDTTLPLTVVPDGALFLCRVNIPEASLAYQGEVELPKLIIVLDTSGSMGTFFGPIVTDRLPKIIARLGYPATEAVTIIPFSNRSSCRTIEASTKELQRNAHRLAAGGRTFMAPVVAQLRAVLNSSVTKRFRIFVLSDGALDDQVDCLNETTVLAKNLALDPSLQINCQAVRLFTSANQPDTRGLASFMQLNNVGTPSLLDIEATVTSARFVEQVTQLFAHDGLAGVRVQLKFSTAIAQRFPWAPAVANLTVTTGSNVFWTSVVPKAVGVEGLTVQALRVQLEPAAPAGGLYQTLEPTLNGLLERCKVLKVVNSDASREEVDKILEYTRSLERTLETGSAVDLEELLRGGATARFAHLSNLVRKRKGNVLTRIAEIANDDRVARLTAAQQADFLRQVGTTSTGKALARRAEKFGLDFTAMLLGEIEQMARHLGDIEDIDDAEHCRSFYSQETTLDGIKTVCSLSIDELAEMEAIDILQLINVVGVACRGPVGDYPDPMTWRVLDLYPGCYISNSDLLVGYLQTQGQMKLRPPGFPDGEITAVIPVFDDVRVQLFLQTHAPNLLELYCSIGMRRVISGVPHTYMYTLCGGLWCLVQSLCLPSERTTVAVRTLHTMLHTYRELCGTHWHRVLPHITRPPVHRNGDAKDLPLSYYIENNGLTNMIDPLQIIIAAGDVDYVPHVLRAIYAFEVHQVVRKLVRHNLTANPRYVEEVLLNPLLGVDFARHGVKLNPLFVADPRRFRWMADWHVDVDALQQYHKRFAHADQAVLMPLLFAAVLHDRLADLADLPAVSDDVVHRLLGLDADLSVVDFRAACIVQACQHLSKDSRVDADAKQMKFVDLASSRAVREVIGGYVRAQYSNDYSAKYLLKKNEEKAAVKDRLVQLLVDTDDLDQFTSLLRDGLTIPITDPPASSSDHTSSSSSSSSSSSPGCSPRRSTSPSPPRQTEFTHIISNTSSLGFAELQRQLVATDRKVPLRLKKLAMFLTGLDASGHPLWNGGNPVRVLSDDMDQYARFFQASDVAQKMWRRIVKRLKSAVYQYRSTMPNRHTHWNPKPSYFALGYPTIEQYFLAVSAEEWLQYKQAHVTCCGLDKAPWSTGQITKQQLQQIELQRKQQRSEHRRRHRDKAKRVAKYAVAAKSRR